MNTRKLAWAAGALLLIGGGLPAQQTTSSPAPGSPGGGRQGRGGPGGPQEQAQIKPGEECPPGMTEFRAGRCGKPATAPPSIVDYRPQSTVVAEQHLVPRAKYPVVDIHNHQAANAENMERLIKEMDSLNLRVLVNLSGGNGERLKQNVETIRSSAYKDRFRTFVNV